MAPDPPPPTTIVHATVGVQFLQNFPLPLMPYVEKDNLKGLHELQRDTFCKVYSGLLDDVEALDPQLQSKFSAEIIRIVSTLSTSFRIQSQQKPELQDFSQRLERLEHDSPSLGAVQGLSGATVLDYLVDLMTEKAGFKKLRSLEIYQTRLVNLNLAKAIREVLEVEEAPEQAESSEFLKMKEAPGKAKACGKAEAPKKLLRVIGLPKVLFICVGPHKHNKSEREDQGQDKTDENETEENETAQNGKVENGKVHNDHVYPDIHVVASSTEAFADDERKRWAQQMQYERMRSVSVQNFKQVCATEREFFNTPAPTAPLGGRNGNPPSKMVRRANLIPYWQSMHHSPDASVNASTDGPVPGPDARIGVFDHSCETAAAFHVVTGFKRRARCFKCESLYLYHRDRDSIRAEADMEGPHRSEPMYNWLPKGTSGQTDTTNQGGEMVLKGPSCAEPLCHLLCTELM